MITPLLLIMGIVNVTPDSFSDGGNFLAVENALAQAKRLIEDGADILDIGGESTRPHATPVPPDVEQQRILPVINAIKKITEKSGVIISVDTRNASTMKAAIDHGVDIINDVSALTHDTGSIKIIAASNAKIVLMHMQGTPETMQNSPHYKNVVGDVSDFLASRIAACSAAGIDKSRIIIDPGLGFGKTPEHNAQLLANARQFQKLGVPVLIGASRKNFLSALTDKGDVKSRLPASLAAAILAYEQGAQIIRVHDVKETRQALMFWQALGNIDKHA